MECLATTVKECMKECMAAPIVWGLIARPFGAVVQLAGKACTEGGENGAAKISPARRRVLRERRAVWVRELDASGRGL